VWQFWSDQPPAFAALPHSLHYDATSQHGKQAGDYNILVTSRGFGFAECVPPGYQFAPVFLIRMAGVPFEPIEQLSTPATSAAARELLVRREELAKAKLEVEQILRSRPHGLSKEVFRAWHKAIRSSTAPAPGAPLSGPFATYSDCLSRLSSAESDFDESLRREMRIARQSLFKSAQRILPAYLVFAGEGLAERLTRQFSIGESLPPRNKEARAHERTILLYLQRVCGKNDSLSAFGPSGWGKAERGIGHLRLAPEPDIAQRECFLERWVAHSAAAVLNADPGIRIELPPRLHPNGRLEGNQFVLTDTGETSMLEADTADLLVRCDGQTPAYALGVEPKLLQELAQQNIVRWEIEVPALEPHAFDVLLSDISRWREGPHRARWLGLLQPISLLPEKFADATDTAARMKIIEEADARLDQLGVVRKAGGRFLYSATNPIGEECFRECHFSIDENLINEVARDAAPWIDFWRDCYAFIAGRVAAGLRRLLAKAPLQSGALPLPAFLHHCEALNMPLTGPGLVGLAHIAFQEVKAAFRERMRDRAAGTECELTAEDCQLVRQNFQFEKFDEYTYPSADLQLSAESIEAVARGEYQWILAELHPPVALLHHGFYWSCPDKPALTAGLTSTLFRRLNFHWGFFAVDFTATTTVSLPDALPDLSYFVAPQRGKQHWQIISPAEAEVYVDPTNGDVCLRKVENHQYLGSFARNWIIPLGFHPFLFGMAPHIPRLRCGKVIVQRRSWVVTQEELPAGDYTGVSRDLVLAVEQLRAQRDLPRYVYIRPTEQALRRSGAEGRDKDTKPVFVDLESYLFLEIFHRWLTKSGELEVTEMLPDPDHLLWKEPDGRRTFELRTLIVPRA
jgi:hypothetical protein